MAKSVKYDENSIDVHLQLDGVRKTPQVYIGTPDSNGRLLIAKEIIQNGFDELTNKEVKTKSVIVSLQGEEMWIADPGRGIPVGIHKTTKISTLTTVLTTLSAGGKMRAGDDAGYSKATGGIHGMGASITNALSLEFEVWTFRDNKWHNQLFKKGKSVRDIKIVKPPSIPNVEKKLQFKQGTIIKFIADPSVFEKGAKLELDDLKRFLDISSYLIPGVKIHLFTEKKHIEYIQPKGLAGYLANRVAKNKSEVLGKVFEYHGDTLDLAMCWSNYPDEDLNSFVNGVPTPEHGTHVNGLSQAIMDALLPLKLKKHKFKSEDLRAGLIAVMNVQVMQPKFTTQNKVKLATIETASLVKDNLKKALATFFSSNKSLAKQIIQRAHDLASAKAEFKINKQAITNLKSNKKGKLLLPAKLMVAHTKNPMEKELFIVEGDSARGTCPDARDPYYQEVLPLKGKPLNIFQNKTEKIFGNEEIINILQSIGFGGKDLRVGKIILLMDSDEDGKHISVLMLAIMFKMFPKLIESGNLYAVNAPLFTTQHNKKRYYAASRKALIEKLPEALRSKVNVTRIKGWGEVEPELLEEVAFNPKTRKLNRITAVKGGNLQKFLSVVGSDTDFRKELLGL